MLSVNDLSGKSNVAMPHKLIDGKWQPLDWYVWNNATAAGGIISSASDMAKWMNLQLNRGAFGDTRIFSEDASRTMWTPHNTFTVSKSSEETFPSTHFRGYGLGWSLMDYLGHKVTMHGGGYDGMFSQLALVPEEKLGMVILTNGMTSVQNALMYRILDTYIGKPEKDWSAYYLQRSKQADERKAKAHEKAQKERVDNTVHHGRWTRTPALMAVKCMVMRLLHLKMAGWCCNFCQPRTWSVICTTGIMTLLKSNGVRNLPGSALARYNFS